MGLFILILLIGVPLVEISLFIKVGGIVGGWTTVGLIVLTAVVGLTIVRAQGVGIINKLNRDMAAGAFPVGAAFEGIALFIAGALLIVPGFMTDTLGFLLLIPPLRRFLGEKLAPNVHFQGFSARSTRPGRHPEQGPAGPDMLGGNRDETVSTSSASAIIIEGEYSEIKDPDTRQGGDGVANNNNT
ncbi:MAG: FxsA family protein [Rhodospirillaceae bacterium]|nr:FxsA family protein [Rhodospirillaceae bacterium]